MRSRLPPGIIVVVIDDCLLRAPTPAKVSAAGQTGGITTKAMHQRFDPLKGERPRGYAGCRRGSGTQKA